jgi:hypothetical protein
MRSFLFALVAFAAVNVAAETLVQYPIATVTEQTTDAAFGDRFRRNKQQPQTPGQPAPPADGNRTSPVDPNAAPKFEAAPDGESAPLNLAELTPEQKQQLFTAISSLISLILGAFAGSGKAGPFITAILGAFKGIADPVPAPARTRVRKPRAKAKAKPKAAAPESK